MEIFSYVATALAAYFLGSIPTGYLAGLCKRVDIRSVGSGNIGATNVFRTLGRAAGVAVLAIDAVKGYVACKWVTYLAYEHLLPVAQRMAPAREGLMILTGLAAILGHNYTCWLKFKGGKGIATTAGVLLGLMPWALATIFSMWLLVTLATRFVSLGSVAAAITLPFAAWGFYNSWNLSAVGTVMCLLALYKHRTNIQRLLNGTESRISLKKEPSAPNP